MMYMFFGDSHSRQFVGTSYGIFSHYVFSGATIKGLVNNQSVTGHSHVIKHAISSTTPKILFFMFGSVDLDFSYIRAHCLGDVDRNIFIKERIDIYCRFLETVRNEGSGISRIHVIAPQLSPLMGHYFFVQVAKTIRIDEKKVREVAASSPLSDSDRCQLVIEFNDRLERAFKDRLGIDLLRIDRVMLGSDMKIKPAFISNDPYDHHACLSQTQRLWRDKINTCITDHIIVG